jgi:hypothetical protein
MNAIHLIKNKNLIYEQRWPTFINEVQAGIITIRCFKKEAQMSREFTEIVTLNTSSCFITS